MILNTQKYRGEFGEIKFSKAKSKSQFQGKTKGLALKYVLDGEENYQFNGDNIHIKKGQFLLLKEYEKYKVSFENKKDITQGICIDLNLSLDKKLFDLYENEILFKTAFKCNNFSPLGNSLQNFSKKINEEMKSLEILNLISSQLISFSDDISEMQKRLDFFAKKTETQRTLISKLMTAKDFIYKNYNHKITLEHLSFESGISKFHFSKLFKNCFQKSPLELQGFLRMEEAKKIILAKKMKLTDVAFYLGYSDLAAFSNQFKKYFGTPPSYFYKN